MKTQITEKLEEYFAAVVEQLNQMGKKLDHDEVIDLAREFEDLAADCMFRIEQKIDDEQATEDKKEFRQRNSDYNASR